MYSSSVIRRSVMMRVRVIHTLRPLFSSTALAVLLLALAVWGIAREVWVAQVVANAEHLPSAQAFLTFLVSAFINTEVLVQVLAVLAIGSMVWLARGFAHTLSGTGRFAS